MIVAADVRQCTIKHCILLLPAAAGGKFVSGPKVLAAVPSISQPRRVYEDRLETGGAGKELSRNNEIQNFGRVVFWNGE